MTDLDPELSDPELKEPHLSNRVMAALLQQLDERWGIDEVDAVLAAAGLPREYLSRPDGWVSLSFERRLTREVAGQLHGLDELPRYDDAMWTDYRDAGRRVFDPALIGPMYQVVRAFGSPGRLYRQVPTLNARANRLTRYELISHGRGTAVLRLTPLPGGAVDPQNCWFSRGLFEALPTVWGKPLAEVEHRQCLHHPREPSDACVYRIRFSDRSSGLVAGAAMWSLGGAALGAAAGVLAGLSELAWLTAALGATAGLAAAGWRRYVKMSRYARDDADDLNDLLADADERYASLWEEQMALRRSILTARKLSGYLARDLVERILDQPELELELGGKRTDAAVLFADIVSFTPRCEPMEPEQVVEDLNTYFSHIDPCFERHGGIIDKRMGDGIMGVFVPAERNQDPVELRASRCALDMLSALSECNAVLAQRDAAPFQIRVGVASGSLVQGNMGSPIQLEYTVIGDTVNLASRLEGAATPGYAMVPQEFIEGLSETEFDPGEHKTIRVKGRAAPVDVVNIRPIGDE